jgi:hypothetical protein
MKLPKGEPYLAFIAEKCVAVEEEVLDSDCGRDALPRVHDKLDALCSCAVLHHDLELRDSLDERLEDRRHPQRLPVKHVGRRVCRLAVAEERHAYLCHCAERWKQVLKLRLLDPKLRVWGLGVGV